MCQTTSINDRTWSDTNFPFIAHHWHVDRWILWLSTPVIECDCMCMQLKPESVKWQHSLWPAPFLPSSEECRGVCDIDRDVDCSQHNGLMLYLPKKKAVQVHNKWQKQKVQFSYPENSVLQFHIFRLLCVMDLISSISPISPSNKVRHGPFGACSGIFWHKLFTKSRFRCIVYKLPSIFLVLWHTKLQLFLQWLPLKHLTLCGTFVAGLGPLPNA